MKKEKINLMNDYNFVAHPKVMEALQGRMDERFVGYGTDEVTDEAKTMVQSLVKNPEADVHFLIGGTQANLIAASAFLRPHEALITPFTGHTSMHETGAIEAIGHKVITQESTDGKLLPKDIADIVAFHFDEHMVKPRMVCIAQTTEYGGVYTRKELEALRRVCDEHKLLFYIDGARLSIALTAKACDFDLPAIAELADAFYLGGTKNGLLFGEAMVISNPSLKEDFRHLIKQRGGLLAKGFLLGIQFKALFENDLYLDIAKQANAMAAKLSDCLEELGYSFEIDTESNQVFPIVNNSELERLHENIDFEEWHKMNSEETSIRFVTTWKTTEEDIEAAVRLLG